MFCINCSSEISRSAKFCPKCGIKNDGYAPTLGAKPGKSFESIVLEQAKLDQQPVGALLDKAQIVKLAPRVLGGARWFWWIAGLSIINSVIAHTSGNAGFLIGLGITQISDAVFINLKPIAIFLDALAVSFFVAMGWFAARGHVWAFLAGGIVYALDAVVFLLFEDWLPAAFHGLALFFIHVAYKELRILLKNSNIPPLVSPSLESNSKV
jgi:hypothetical protein